MCTVAPPGLIWICTACGKFSEDKHGDAGWKSPGWDESCMLNSELVDVDQVQYAGIPARMGNG